MLITDDNLSAGKEIGMKRATLLAFTFALFASTPALLAQEQAAAGASASVLHLLGVALGLGLIVIGAGLGIGKLAAAAAEGIARQPGAAAQITGAVNLPLFLLEGVAILAEVFALLVLLLANPLG
jgi:F-type H+-transporting ATPase subunit c